MVKRLWNVLMDGKLKKINKWNDSICVRNSNWPIDCMILRPIQWWSSFFAQKIKIFSLLVNLSSTSYAICDESVYFFFCLRCSPALIASEWSLQSSFQSSFFCSEYPKYNLIIQLSPALNKSHCIFDHFFCRNNWVNTSIYPNVCKLFCIDLLPHTRKRYKMHAILWSSPFQCISYLMHCSGVKWIQQ